MPHEELEEVELDARELDEAVAPPHLARLWAELEVAEGQRGGRRTRRATCL
jgi:hypothetical protein